MTSIAEHAHQRIAAVSELGDEASRIFSRWRPDELLEAAVALDRRRTEASELPLYGRFVSLKDLFDEAGVRTLAGSRLLADRAPAGNDAEVVARLRAAGALVIGRTSLSEFAYSGVGLNPHTGTPHNAYDPARIPGGSTSGGALSVAYGLADIAIGTDTGGSVRIPAAANGLFGFKPTQAAISRTGVHPLARSYDTVGPIAADLDAIIEVFDVLHDGPGSPSEAASQLVQATRPLYLAHPIGILTHQTDRWTSIAFGEIQRRLTHAGHRIETVDLAPLADLSAANRVIVSVEAYAQYSADLERLDAIGDPHVLARIRYRESLSDRDTERAYAQRAEAISLFRRKLGPFDALIAPTLAIEVPSLRATEHDFDRINAAMLSNPSVINLVDGCAITLPIRDCAVGGLPFSALMLARAGSEDAELLAVARRLASPAITGTSRPTSTLTSVEPGAV